MGVVNQPVEDGVGIVERSAAHPDTAQFVEDAKEPGFPVMKGVIFLRACCAMKAGHSMIR